MRWWWEQVTVNEMMVRTSYSSWDDGENQLQSMRWYSVCTRSCRLSWICIMLAHWNNSVSTIRHIFLIPSQSPFALTPYCCMLIEETSNINFIGLGFTRSGLEPTIYWHPGEHTNQYTIFTISMNFLGVLHNILNNMQLFSLLIE